MAQIKTAFQMWPWQYWAEQRPTEIAIALGDANAGAVTWNWIEVTANIETYAQRLVAQGVKRDQLVAVVAPNSIDVLWLLLAIIRVGARYVGLNPKLPSKALIEQLTALGNNHIWCPDISVAEQLPGHTLSLNPAVTSERIIPVMWQEHRPVSLTLTSGSTGLPKAVVHHPQSHLASASGLLKQMTFTADDSWLLSLPLFHISGLAIVWRWLYRGARIVLVEPALQQQALQWVSHASLVPTQLQRFLDSEYAHQHQLQQVLLGGATIPVSLTTAAEQAGIECWSGYGMTEMASTITVKRANSSAGVGTVLPNRELILRDGEIWVRGKVLCLGYYRNNTIFSLLGCDDDDDDWFATKDLGEWHDDELFIRGRADNMFISGGENVQPEDIEQVLLQHAAVNQVIVLPIDDHDFGARPVAIVTTAQPLDSYLVDQLVTYMSQNVAPHKRPIRYLSLPDCFTQNVKVSRSDLAKWLASQA
ncbi:o-succinylbenzoate--CoA ligase [Photobacterium carnosum]|uniref:o-succinylbenzoate--CoA ligase n=1 Tax=Photobacterium carnosum TaxID=2023717 RepID=UPI00128D4D63|nr:o-succinylbenzoate--CoA ligase [Photobacterium carnosum]KAE8178002.1 o-succinylbenzoate--CoA ligase [Photobacterium carnosum]MCD9525980.1 o-succinylbenzoate--CoA ligase [Photobacterium carnosum]